MSADTQAEEGTPATPPARPGLHLPLLRAITLWQPWATLMVIPSVRFPAMKAKRYETRSWPTEVRGVVAIHAAKKVPNAHLETVERCFWGAEVQAAFRAAGLPEWKSVNEMPSGILGVGRLTGCHKTNTQVRTYIEAGEGREQIIFGDFSDGRWIHEYEDVVRLQEPVACRGMQQFWDVPGMTVEAIARQLAPVFPKIHREIRTVLEPHTW